MHAGRARIDSATRHVERRPELALQHPCNSAAPPRVGGKTCALGREARATATVSLTLRIGHLSAPSLAVTLLRPAQLLHTCMQQSCTQQGSRPHSCIHAPHRGLPTALIAEVRGIHLALRYCGPLCKLICSGCRFTHWILRACRLRVWATGVAVLNTRTSSLFVMLVVRSIVCCVVCV